MLRCSCLVGCIGVLALLALALYSGNPWWLSAMPAMGYGFARVGHFFFEKNRPATFSYPLWSILSESVICRDMLIGKIRF